MATTGAQPGNQNARKAKRWQEALGRALNRAVGGAGIDAGLDRIADQVVSKAFDGDPIACKEIAERFDGKVPQGIIGGDSDDPAIKIEQIERTIVRPSDSNG